MRRRRETSDFRLCMGDRIGCISRSSEVALNVFYVTRFSFREFGLKRVLDFAMSSSPKPPDLFYNGETAKGLKLLEIEKNGKLSVSSQGCQVLAGLDKQQACNLMFIFGNARSGKSFMM